MHIYLLQIMLLLYTIKAQGAAVASAASVAKPGCEDKCGNVSIPYPFGIGANCSATTSFRIFCNTSFNPPKPFLDRNMILELLEISLEKGTIRLLNPLVTSGCNRTDKGLTVDFSSTPFSFSYYYSRFTAMGCNNFALINQQATTIGGCISFCGDKKTSNNFTGCYGINCCQTRIPPSLKFINASLQSIGPKNQNRSDCRYAFMVDQEWFSELESPFEVQSMEKVPVVVDWITDGGVCESFEDDENSACPPSKYGGCPRAIGKGYDNSACSPSRGGYDRETRKGFGYGRGCDRERKGFGCGALQPKSACPRSRNTTRGNDNSTLCGTNAKCSPFGLCYCSKGFHGNPYLPNGCQDIDECASPETNKCDKKCVNTQGGYNCSCPSEYEFHPPYSCFPKPKDTPEDTPNMTRKMVMAGIGTSLGALLLIIGTWRLCKVMKRRKKTKLKKKFFKRNGGLLLEQQLSSGEEGNVDKTKIFASKELEKATDQYNENRILGQGGQGTVYKGMLTDGRIVAIKKSKIENESKLELEQFINEVVILSQINHRNVVKLHGCCLETEVPMLVYEFIPNGTLYQYIHDENPEFPLSWDIRLRIAIEIAGALSYLHSAAYVPIYHRDIKSLNILLDEKFRAKVADFGTSKSIAIDQTHITTKVIGTFGYMDPEYYESSKFTEKSDVYSFGVVLVELLTGQKAVSSIRSGEGRSLASYFKSAIKEDHLFDILDARITREEIEDEIKVVANLANRCLNLEGNKRPTMREVAMELEGIRKPKGAHVQEHHEDHEVEDVVEGPGPWDTGSTSTGSFASACVSASWDAQPLRK